MLYDETGAYRNAYDDALVAPPQRGGDLGAGYTFIINELMFKGISAFREQPVGG